MKIGIITTSFLPRIGGAEMVIHHLANYWHDYGHKVRILNSTSNKVAHPDGKYSVKKLKLLRGGRFFGIHNFPYKSYAINQIKIFIDEFRPDFISAHFGYPVGVWLSEINYCPKWFVTIHGKAIRTRKKDVRTRLKVDEIISSSLNKSSGVISISQYVHNQLENVGVNTKKIIPLPHGVEYEKFQDTKKSSIKNYFGIPENSFIILSVGRNEKFKDYHTGLQAFAKISAKYPNVYYLIIGGGTNSLGNIATQLGIVDKVILCEGIYGDDLIAVYQQSDLFFFPSYNETFCLAILEAMAAGLPCVITNDAGTIWPSPFDFAVSTISRYYNGYKPAIISGENGKVFSRGNIGEMVESLVCLIDDGELRKKMGKSNKLKAQKYDWSNIANSYVTLVDNDWNGK